MELKCCRLLGILGKHTKFVAFLVYTINEIPTIFSNLGPGAQSKFFPRALLPSKMRRTGKVHSKTSTRILRFSALKFGNRTTSNSFPGCSSLQIWEGLERRHKKNKELLPKLANCISRIDHFTGTNGRIYSPTRDPFPFLPYFSKDKVPLVELCYDTFFMYFMKTC